MKKYIIHCFCALILFGCNQQNRELNTKIINNNICVFTNESKDYGKDDFLVHLAKIDFSKEYQSEYEESYQNVEFPINEKNCVYISLDKIEKDIGYTITLSTINKSFSSQICLVKQENLNIIKKVEPGQSKCS
jgi:hypothetical protein